jgi:hypothetical protein
LAEETHSAAQTRVDWMPDRVRHDGGENREKPMPTKPEAPIPELFPHASPHKMKKPGSSPGFIIP